MCFCNLTWPLHSCDKTRGKQIPDIHCPFSVGPRIKTWTQPEAWSPTNPCQAQLGSAKPQPPSSTIKINGDCCKPLRSWGCLLLIHSKNWLLQAIFRAPEMSNLFNGINYLTLPLRSLRKCSLSVSNVVFFITFILWVAVKAQLF